MKYRCRSLLSVILSLIVPTFAIGQSTMAASQNSGVPRLIKITGTLKDSSGNLLNNTVGAMFAVYSEQTGGVPLWQETRNVQCSQGRYTMLLGESTAEGIPADLFASGQPRWLGVQVLQPGEQEQPRVLLASVPYALKAGDADTLGGLPASAFLKSQALTSTKNVAVTQSNVSAKGSSVGPLTLSNVTTSGGTGGTIPLFNTPTDIENSPIVDSSGTISINAPLTVSGVSTLISDATGSSLNTVVNPMSCALSSHPGWCSGSDLGAWINGAISKFLKPNGCGIVQLPYQLQTKFTTTILKPRCTLIDLNQSTILWQGTAAQAIVVADTNTGPPNLGGIQNGRIFGGTAQIISSSNGIFLGGTTSSNGWATNQVFYDLDVQNFKDDFIVGYNAYLDTWVGGVIGLSSEAGIHFETGTTNTGENFSFQGVNFGNNQLHDILVDSGAFAEINAIGTSFDYAGGTTPPANSDSISSSGTLFLNASSSHFERSLGAKFINCSGSCSVGVANSAMYLNGQGKNPGSTDAFGQFGVASHASFVGVDWANFNFQASGPVPVSQLFVWNDGSGFLSLLNFRNTLPGGLTLTAVPLSTGATPANFSDSRTNFAYYNPIAFAAPRLNNLPFGTDLNTITRCGLYDVTGASHGPSLFGTGFFHFQVLCTNDTRYQDQVAYDMVGGTNRTLIRHELNGTWSSWAELLSPNDSGDQTLNGNVILPFFLTGYHGTNATEVQLSDGSGSAGNEAVFASDGKTITNSMAGQANHATCWKAVGQLGSCSGAVNADGTCNCN